MTELSTIRSAMVHYLELSQPQRFMYLDRGARDSLCNEMVLAQPRPFHCINSEAGDRTAAAAMIVRLP